MARPDRENDMLAAVLKLFPKKQYRRFTEVPLGKKRIDLFCKSKNNNGDSICVELKIDNWKSALWQASRNFHLGKKSYVAIWHEYANRVTNNLDLFSHYGVGIILVEPNRAHVLVESVDRIARSSRITLPQVSNMLEEV